MLSSTKSLPTRAGVWDVLRTGLGLALRQMLLGMLGACAVLLWFAVHRTAFRQLPGTKNWKEAQAQDQPLVEATGDVTLAEFHMHFVQWDLTFYTFNVLWTMMYVTFTFRSALSVFIGFVVGYVARTVVRGHLPVFYTLVPFVGVILGMIAGFRSVRVAKHFVKQLVVLVGGTFVLQALRRVKIDNDAARLMVACGAMPLLRELSGSGLRHVVRGFYNVDESKLDVLYPLVMWFQVLAALLVRLFFTQIDSPQMLVAIVIFQAVVELAMRISLPLRDDLQIRAFEALAQPCRGRRASIQPHSLGEDVDGPETERGKAAARLAKRRALQARIVATESIGEYAAIFAIPGLIYMFREERLSMPLEYFLSLDDPVHSALHLGPLVRACLLQATFEVFVDICAHSYEARQGLDVSNAVRVALRLRLMPVMVISSCFFASACLFTYVFYQDNFDSCAAQDLCCCICQGLRSGGLRERYCVANVHPASLGAPMEGCAIPPRPLQCT